MSKATVQTNDRTFCDHGNSQIKKTWWHALSACTLWYFWGVTALISWVTKANSTYNLVVHNVLNTKWQG